MSLIDVLIVALAILFAIGGLRQGFVCSVLSVAGLFGGTLLGIQLGPHLARLAHGDGTQAVIAVIVVVALASIGATAASIVGVALRRRMPSDGARVVDSLFGALVSGLAVLITAWLVAAPLASSSYPKLAASVRGSAILRGVDREMPGSARKVYNSMTELLDRSEFPAVFGGLTPTRVRNVPAPDPALVADPDVATARASIVKVTGIASSCSRQIEGSGFVVAPHRVVTNAHVVAGVDAPTVHAGADDNDDGGTEFDAKVVLYDADTDLAVLDVPGLNAPPLSFADGTAKSGADAIIAGYPGDGPFYVGAARVRGSETIRGPDIYGDRTVRREVYALRADVRNGNSGGPLLAPNGEVYGVIFAAAADQAQTGFALTHREIEPDLQRAANASSRVGTGSCAD